MELFDSLQSISSLILLVIEQDTLVVPASIYQSICVLHGKNPNACS